jgi:aminoglycoside phosphotransferase (APT) family kinase protein
MMKRQLLKIHGHSQSRIGELLTESCELIDKNVVLDTLSLGGWSNINIKGRFQDYEFVLKLPWSTVHYETNPYSYLYDLLQIVSKSKLTTPPLALGRFKDRKETPFILLQYVDGFVHSSIAEATSEELHSLKDALYKLSLLKLPGLKTYTTPLAYLYEIHRRVSDHERLSSASRDVLYLVRMFSQKYASISQRVESLEAWSRETMHGDLWEPNILFNEGGVLLLDFELCCIGDPLYDLAYLIEASDRPHAVSIPDLISNEAMERIHELRPVVLMSLVSWSLERLISMDAGIVEANLTSPQIRENMIRYSKMRLAQINTSSD